MLSLKSVTTVYLWSTSHPMLSQTKFQNVDWSFCQGVLELRQLLVKHISSKNWRNTHINFCQSVYKCCREKEREENKNSNCKGNCEAFCVTRKRKKQFSSFLKGSHIEVNKTNFFGSWEFNFNLTVSLQKSWPKL